MWLCDLEKALSHLREVCPDYVFTKIVPAGSGIVFYTSHHTRVLWTNDGQVIERDEVGNIKFLRNYPNI